MAFAIYTTLVWTSLDILRAKNYQQPTSALIKATKRVRPLAVASAGMLSCFVNPP